MVGTIVRCALVAGVLVALSAPLALAQTADDLTSLRKDIKPLKEGQAALLRELQQIKSLLSRSAPAPRAGAAPARAAPEVVLTSATRRRRASKDAKITWSSSPTTSDRSAAGTSVRRTRRSTETTSRPACCGTSSATCRWNDSQGGLQGRRGDHCARDQGKYWEMHGRLFANQRQLGRDDLTNTRRRSG